MRTLLSRITVLALGLAISVLVPTMAAAQYLVDTGPGGTTTIGAAALFATGSTSCSPQPACATHFQYLAGQFTLSQAATISAIELWLPPFGTGGNLNVKIRSDNNGLPGVAEPFRLRPNHIFSKTYTVPNRPGSAGWFVFSSYDTVLAAGTYWVTFEPVGPSNFNMTPPVGAPNPLAKAAYFGNGNPGYLALPASQSSLGIRIAGTNFPGLGFGSGSRTMLDGSVFGCCHVGPYDFLNGGESQALTVSYIFVIPAGHTHGRGKLFPNGLSAGAYSFTSGPCSGGSCANAAGRGVAYRTYVNLSDVTKTFRINAVLDGAFFNAGGNAAAGVYALDTTGFTNTINGSGIGSAQYLLQRDNLAALATGGTALSLASLFPGSVLTSDFETPTYPTGQVGSTQMSTGFITLAPDETFTLLFDVSAYAPGGGAANFANTLAPAANLFTDSTGQPVREIVAVGPSAAPTPAATALTLASANTTTPVATPYTVTATATGAGGIPVPDVPIVFTITAGPNAGTIQTVSTDSNGRASFTYFGSVLGTDSLLANIGTLQSNAVQNTWQIGGLDHIVISPASATVAAGSAQPYTAEAFDALSNSRGDVTGATTFTITPDGSCTNASCTPTAPGGHTVTGTYEGKTAPASLTATGIAGYSFTGFFSPVDNAPVLNVIKAGSAVPVKFSLDGNQGLNILASGYPASQPITCDVTLPSDTIEQTVSAGSSGLTYDASANQYVYVWKTDKAWANSCRLLNLTLNDGTSHLAFFQFSK